MMSFLSLLLEHIAIGIQIIIMARHVARTPILLGSKLENTMPKSIVLGVTINDEAKL